MIGNIPLEKDSDTSKEEKETIKANVLKLLAHQYGIDEEDFQSAELEIVPAGKARDCGFDRSMVLSYGQDDRICAFTSLFRNAGRKMQYPYPVLSAGRQGRNRKCWVLQVCSPASLPMQLQNYWL